MADIYPEVEEVALLEDIDNYPYPGIGDFCIESLEDDNDHILVPFILLDQNDKVICLSKMSIDKIKFYKDYLKRDDEYKDEEVIDRYGALAIRLNENDEINNVKLLWDMYISGIDTYIEEESSDKDSLDVNNSIDIKFNTDNHNRSSDNNQQIINDFIKQYHPLATEILENNINNKKLI